jgi:hypothetical protein
VEPSAFWRFTKVNVESYDRLGALVTTRSRATEGMPKTAMAFYYQGKPKRGALCRHRKRNRR